MKLIKIIYQDKDILVIDKPAHWLVQPTGQSKEKTITDWLISRYPEIKQVGDDPQRPGLVHRLDRETSGLMVVARNQASFAYLKKLFQERKVIKKYLALVYGSVKDDQGLITKAITSSKKDFRKKKALLDSRAKRAWTEYRVLKRYPGYTFLEVWPQTGRTHQIRVHLASIGHPIVADKNYQFKRQAPPCPLERHFLHACYLKFSLASGKMIELVSEMPQELKRVLDFLENG